MTDHQRVSGLTIPIAGLILALTACGPSAEDRATDAKADAAAASASAQAEAQAAREAELAAAEAALDAAVVAEWQACRSATRELNDALRQIDSRLDIGLNHDDLGDRLGDVMVAYDALDIGSLDPSCVISVAVALEGSLNHYARSLTQWSDCLDDYDCRVEGAVLRDMRDEWRKASKRLGDVEQMLSTADAYADAAY